MIKPNYTVRALIPYPSLNDEPIINDGLFKKADSLISVCFKARRRTYQFLLLSFCIFSVLGIYYYNYSASGLTPVSMYTPTVNNDNITLTSVFLFRRLHIIASIFLMLSGFTVFGSPVSLLFIASDAFVMGFTIKYSLTLLQGNSSFILIALYFFCISLYAIIDILFGCEVIRYSRYARGGTKEMLNARRFAGFITTILMITIFNMCVSYLFVLISI